jgi:hypothetical protein
MSGIMDGVSKLWVMRCDRGLDLHGVANEVEAPPREVCVGEGCDEGADPRGRREGADPSRPEAAVV